MHGQQSFCCGCLLFFTGRPQTFHWFVAACCVSQADSKHLIEVASFISEEAYIKLEELSENWSAPTADPHAAAQQPDAVSKGEQSVNPGSRVHSVCAAARLSGGHLTAWLLYSVDL